MSPRSYYRVMLGPKSVHADQARQEGFIGAGFIKDIDFSNHLYENWREFNKKYIPVYLKQNPDKAKVAAGLACGMLWTIAKGIQRGDIVLSPDGKGNYFVGEVISDYKYQKGGVLPHRRDVNWYSQAISRADMSEALQNSIGSIGTLSNISRHANEIEKLISGDGPVSLVATDETVEDPTIFALEKHLEEFLVENWKSTELGKKYDIFEVDGEMVGQQYPSDTGPIDILAVSKDKKELLVVELKKGRSSDAVIGQIQRYMGYVKDELAESNQRVKGAIIAFEDDLRIKRALSVTQNIDFFSYKVSFKLMKH